MAEAYSPVYREIHFLSPFEAYERLRGKNTILLESGKGPERIARYSFICVDPYLSFRAKDAAVEIEVAGRKTISSRHPLARLRELVGSYRQQSVPDLPPFQGGAAGMLSYDFVYYIERVPSRAADDLQVPDAHFFGSTRPSRSAATGSMAISSTECEQSRTDGWKANV